MAPTIIMLRLIITPIDKLNLQRLIINYNNIKYEEFLTVQCFLKNTLTNYSLNLSIKRWMSEWKK